MVSLTSHLMRFLSTKPCLSSYMVFPFSSNQRCMTHLVKSRSCWPASSSNAISFHNNCSLGNDISVKSSVLCQDLGRSNILMNSIPPYHVMPIRNYQSALRPRLVCKGCYFVWRHGRKFVECSDFPRHKQMKKMVKRKIWQEDYSKGDIQKAMIWHRVIPRQCARTVDRTALSHNWLAGKLGTEL